MTNAFIVLVVICLTVVEAQKQENSNKRPTRKQSGNKRGQQQSIKEKFKKKNEKFKRFVITDIPGVGKVRGRRSITAWTHKHMYEYFDIKYGETTSGKNRFKAPKAAKEWTGLRSAVAPRHGCPSLADIDLVEEAEIQESADYEDCLTLTISTKSHSAKAPVLVYIHGNYLYDGNPIEASPEYLLEKDVVLVSVRYRLGPFGFLSTMTEHIPGNAAVKDVILALEWIQQNIYVFGGDPDSVTLFGQVGGASMINILTMSPIVPDGLFHKVIYQSGSALTPALTTDDPLEFAKEIGKQAKCPNVNSVAKLNKCLMKMNVTSILEAFNNQGSNDTDYGITKFGGTQFVIGGPSEVLPDFPGKLIQEKKIKYYPTMGGVVKNPGTFILRDLYEAHFNFSVPDDKLTGPQYLDYIIDQTNGEDPTGQWKKFAMKEFFTKEELDNGTFAVLLPGIIDMCSTIPFKNPVLLALQANAEKMPENTFLYTFNYEGEYHSFQSSIDDIDDLPFDMGVSLTDENIYLFRWPKSASFLSNRDSRIAKLMVELWTSFAANGVPSSNRAPEWPPMTKGSGPYIKIDRVSTIGQNFLDEYSAAVREERMGLTLISENYFESLAVEKQHEQEEAALAEKEQKEKENDANNDNDEDYGDEKPKLNFKNKNADNDDGDYNDDDNESERSLLKNAKQRENIVIAGRNE
ncbi:glutactin [Condylostylus longicornis]|uniref:glutactin n=1 Tax=Condylostylus longicornis TaxID=2530218 RepID=UPI00244DB03D|nr:glutactin [Condylostylus longicornis]